MFFCFLFDSPFYFLKLLSFGIVDVENNDKQMQINLEWPFTPWIWLWSAWNFGKTRFRWFLTFHFSTPQKVLAIFFSKILVSIFFSRILRFGRARNFWVSVTHRPILRQKSLPVVRLFFLYDPWRRGKSGTDRFCSWLSAKNDFHTNSFWGVRFIRRVERFIRGTGRSLSLMEYVRQH